MRKIHCIVLISLIFIGLAGGYLMKDAVADGCQSCSCCETPCGCQPQGCGFNWQAFADIESPLILSNIYPGEFLKSEYIFSRPDEPLHLIFHPPRQSARLFLIYLFNH